MSTSMHFNVAKYVIFPHIDLDVFTQFLAAVVVSLVVTIMIY